MVNKIKKPRLIALEVTRHCRFHCPHCRADAGFIDPNSELTTAQWKKILKSIAAFTKCVIIFTGGEPMERADIYGLIRFARKLGFQPVLATCGYLIDEASIKKFKETGLVALSLSLDGASAQTHDAIRQSDGSFDSVIKAAKLAADADLPFQVNTTITKINVDEVNAIAQLAEQIGACCFNPFIFVPTGRGREMPEYMLDPVEYETLLNRLLDLKLSAPIDIRVTCAPQFARVFHQSSAEKRVGAVNGCIGGSEFAFVSNTGDLQICGFLQIPVGNILQKGFSLKKTWQDSELLKQIRDRASYTGKCASCDWREICGGCRARAYATTGDCLAADPLCEHKSGAKR